MTRHIALTSLALAAVYGTAAIIGAQTASGTDRIGWSVSVTAASRTEQPRQYRLYAEPEAFELRVLISNGLAESVLVDQRSLQAGMRFELARENAQVPIQLEWSQFVLLPERREPTPLSQDESVWLRPNTGARWTIVVRRRDSAPFDGGEYRLAVSLQSATRAFRDLNGQTWPGTPIPLATDLFLAIGQAATPREQADALLVSAGVAWERGDRTTAISNYERAVASDPTNLVALERLAFRYAAVGRYRESAALFDRLVGQGQIRLDRRIASGIAAVYLHLNDELNASAILRRAGMSPGEASAQIAELRRRIR